MSETTIIIIGTQHGDAKVSGATYDDAFKKFKTLLKKAGLRESNLLFDRELTWGDETQVLYSYFPTRPRYDNEKALALANS